MVDDDESVREALVCILSEAGYDVRDVGSAREARFALEQDSIALLLSDVSMPGETGSISSASPCASTRRPRRS